MKEQITYKYAAPGSEQFSKLQDFAETFNHSIVPHPQINVYGYYRNNVCFGYCDHVYIPIVYPAFHPKFTRPKDVIQAMSDWKAYMQLSKQDGFVGVPLEESRPNFPNSTMEKLGMKQLKRELFSIN